jgi:hypothetical protein
MSERHMHAKDQSTIPAAMSGDDERLWRSRMDERTIEVEYRLDELRRTSAGIHAERLAGRQDGGPLSGLRLALGRRLVAVGTALQGGAARSAQPTGH